MQFISLIMKSLLPILVSVAFLPFSVLADESEGTTFDPEKQFTIMFDSSILGDPTPFTQLGTDRKGYTYVSHSLTEGFGMTVNFSLIVPLAEGEAANSGGGHLMMKLDEAEKMAAALRKAPEWAKVAEENEVGEYAKDIDIFMGDENGDHSKIVFVSDASNEGAIHIEQQIAGQWKKFRFSINASQKAADTVEHFIEKARSEMTPETPKGDAEKDKLFK